jgi:ribose transport system permease protein
MGMRGLMERIGPYAPIITFAVLFALFAVLTDSFVSTANFYNVFAQNSGLAIMAVGITFVLLCAQIDLSIAAMATFSGVLCARLYVHFGETAMSEVIAIVLAVGAATGLGFVNGAITAWLRVPSFMVTLAMMMITQGLSLYVTRGSPIFDVPRSMSFVGSAALTINLYFLSIPEISVPWITVAAGLFLGAAFVVLRFTRFGRHVYAVGGNPQSAALSGINAKAVTAACLTVSGFTAGVAGVVLIGRLGSAQATGLESMLIACISAVVLGGTSLFGGRGGIGYTVIGLLTFGVLNNGLNHVEMDIYLKQFISGAILLGALVLNVVMARSRDTD